MTAPSPTPVLPLERMLTYRLHQLHKLTDLQSQRAYLDATGLTLSDARCLTTIGSFQPLSINRLAQMGNLNKGQASRAAQFLVDQGWVRKGDRPDDGRGVVLTLTDAGQRLCDQAMAVVAQRNAQIFGCLSDDEQAVLSQMFDRLIAHAQGAAPDTGPS